MLLYFQPQAPSILLKQAAYEWISNDSHSCCSLSVTLSTQGMAYSRTFFRCLLFHNYLTESCTVPHSPTRELLLPFSIFSILAANRHNMYTFFIFFWSSFPYPLKLNSVRTGTLLTTISNT